VGANYKAPAPGTATEGSAVLERRLAFLYERCHASFLIFDRKAGVKQPALEADAFAKGGLEGAITDSLASITTGRLSSQIFPAV